MNLAKRQSNFELLRLITMMMVMVCHASGYVEGSALVGVAGVSKLLVNQLCLVSVNLFVMISGWFGIRASVKGAFNILFQVWFVTLLCFLLFMSLGLPVSFKKNLLPYLLFGSGYWFVVSYLILYALSPVLNAFIDHATKRTFSGVLIAFFTAEFLFGYLLNAGHFDLGFSPLSFVGLYLLSRYARLYPDKMFSFSKLTDFLIYLGATLLSALLFWFGYKWFGMGFHLNHNDSPFVVLAALYFLLCFSKMHFHSQTINWLAASAFAIYLFHENSLVSPYFHQYFHRLYDTIPLAAFYPLMIIILIILGLAFICIDKLRLLIWKRLVKD